MIGVAKVQEIKISMS